MEFTTKKSDLLKELDLAQGVVEKKTTIPILSNLLLEADASSGGRLRLSATDLELGIKSGCPAKVKKAGAGTVPAKRLLDIVRSLPEADIHFKALENNWIQLTCQRSSFKLVGMAKDNFPVLPAIPKTLASIPCGCLATLIHRTSFAISNEESRYTLNGALLVLKPDSVMMVATDGHRLSMIERDVEVAGLNNELKILIPKKALTELQRLLGMAAEGDGESPERLVEVSKDDSHLFFSLPRNQEQDARSLIARLLTGQFPNYEAVLPRDNKLTVELEKGVIEAAVRRVALLADERSRAVRVQVDKDQLEIFSQSGEYGEAHETLDAKYDGDAMQIGFNYQYLLDFLGALDGGPDCKVRLELKDEQSAGQFRPGDDEGYKYRYVVMPMRI